MTNTTKLSHCFYSADKSQCIMLSVNIEEDGSVHSVESIDLWKQNDLGASYIESLDLPMLEDAGLIDPMLDKVDWQMKLYEHKKNNE